MFQITHVFGDRIIITNIILRFLAVFFYHSKVKYLKQK
jgi:hypothetical protein